MPDSILEIVQATVETVKTQKIKPIPGEAKPMPKLETQYKNINEDIGEALKPGERFLTPEEAAARRKKIIEERRRQGLPIQ